MAKVYVTDDKKNTRKLIASFLREQRLDVEILETGDRLLLRFMEREADTVILDVMMPGISGVGIATMPRERSDVPVILLAARGNDVDSIKGLSAGADNYLAKPFSPLKLSLHVKAILACQPQSQEVAKGTSDVVTYETLTLPEKEHTVTYDNRVLKLTGTESELLRMLMNYTEEAASRDEFLHHIWGHESSMETRVIGDIIKRLRKKLRGVDSHVLIETIWDYGFKLTKKQ